ncbi:MAG: two pore domain potassium channel family protein, partial [Desulfamplus sp.]|nr:two pore domain potassium channel family protein [Desulfamplus sp.]
MKFMISQITAIIQDSAKKSNTRLLIRFLLLLIFFFVMYSTLFHLIMEYEGNRYSWITGFYWTLTVMSTLGFGDITFTSDLGR